MNSDLYRCVFTRKSVRKYNMQPLDGSILDQLKEYAKSLESLNPSIAHELVFLESHDVNQIFQVKAPHYLCLYSEQTEGYRMNAGYLLQQMDLYLSSLGLGSCWLGMAKPMKNPSLSEQIEGKKFVILLAFGNAEEEVHRIDISQFKRKKLEDITDLANCETIMEPVRLAPSGVNSQPWFLTGTLDHIIVSREKLSLLKEPVYSKLNQIDIGICLCHLKLSLEHVGRTVSISFDEMAPPSGYQFMASVTS